MLTTLRRCLDEEGDIVRCMHELLPSFKAPEEINGTRGELPADVQASGSVSA